MRSVLAACLLALVSLSQPTAAQDSNPDDPNGKLLYITAPACGFFQCSVTWPKGSRQIVNWLGPTPGNVKVQLISTIGGPTYDIVDNIAATSQEGYCDSGFGERVLAPGHKCGRIEFLVPNGWQEAVNYTVAVMSLRDRSQIGYTDNITIAPAEEGEDDAPAGTSVELLTVPGPTSTNAGASIAYDGERPTPTAVTAQPASSSATSSSVLSTPVDASAAVSSSTAAATSMMVTPSSAAMSGIASNAGQAASSAPAPSTTPTSGAMRLDGAGVQAVAVGLLAVAWLRAVS